MGQLAMCICRGSRPCDRLATQEDLLCNVCRGGCEPLFEVSEDTTKLTIWLHQNDDTIAVIVQELNQGRIPPGGVTKDIP